MSQENPTTEQMRESREKRNKILLGALLITLAGTIYFQFFSGSDAPGSSAQVAQYAARTTPTPAQQRQTGATPAPIISQPLDLASIDVRNRPSGGTGRNIFIYPTPTPPPPPPTPTPIPSPTPWPIPVFSINPGNVIARTADFTLTVFGEKMPQDAQGIINGRAYPTTVVSSTQAKISVPAEAIRTPGPLTVTLRSGSNATVVSNPVSLNVAAPPEPPYKYVGLITVKNTPTATLVSKKSDDDLFHVKKGEIVERRWKIINITPLKVEIEDTSIKVSHILNYISETR